MPAQDFIPVPEDQGNYNIQIEKFLDEFISIIYKGHDHIVARKFYRKLFLQVIPKYFDLKSSAKTKE